ncbi:MAG: hypothetical protein WD032_08860 [Nitrospirales bacterium]
METTFKTPESISLSSCVHTAETLIREQEVLNRCLSFDLSMITFNATKKLGWSKSKATRVENLYRRYLFLCFKYRGKIVPSDVVDAFWELHIIDTKQYFNDCMTLFGFFLHHTPNILLRNPSLSRAEFESRFLQTKDIFAQEFGRGMEDAVMSGCDDCIPDYDPPNPPSPGDISITRGISV